MVGAMETLPVLNQDVYGRSTNSIEGEEDYDLLALCTLFFELIKDSAERFIEFKELKPTLEEKLASLRTILEASGAFKWDMEDNLEQIEKVAIILAMLELTKIKFARISQKRPFGTITLRKRDSVPANKE